MKNVPRWTPVALVSVIFTQYLYGAAQGNTNMMNLSDTLLYVVYAVAGISLMVMAYVLLKSLKSSNLGWFRLVILLLGLVVLVAFIYGAWQALTGGSTSWLVGPFDSLRWIVRDVSSALPFALPYLAIIAIAVAQTVKGRQQVQTDDAQSSPQMASVFER